MKPAFGWSHTNKILWGDIGDLFKSTSLCVANVLFFVFSHVLFSIGSQVSINWRWSTDPPVSDPPAPTTLDEVAVWMVMGAICFSPVKILLLVAICNWNNQYGDLIVKHWKLPRSTNSFAIPTVSQSRPLYSSKLQSSMQSMEKITLGMPHGSLIPLLVNYRMRLPTFTYHSCFVRL